MMRINLLQLALQISFGKLFYLKTSFGCIFCFIMSSTAESQHMDSRPVLLKQFMDDEVKKEIKMNLIKNIFTREFICCSQKL